MQIGVPTTQVGRRELAIVAILTLVICAMFVAYKTARVDLLRGDSAIFFQLTANIADGRGPVSQVLANTLAFQHSHLVTTPAAEIAHDPLAPPAEREHSMLSYHAYLVLFPMALVAKVVPIPLLFFFLIVLSFVATLSLTYLALRTVRVPPAAAAIFCLLVASHPAWWQGLMYGQIFPDRLFILAGFAFMLLALRGADTRLLQVLAGVVCLIINERAAATAGLFLLLYVALYWKRPGLDRWFKLGLSAALLCYAVFVLKIALANPEYSGFLPQSLDQVMRLFAIPQFREMALLLILVNLPLLILSAFEWRLGAIAVVMLLPNLLGNIGGAEKTGWATHYHDYYLPSLIFAALFGFARLYRASSVAKRPLIAYALVAILAIAANAIDPTAFATPSISLANVANVTTGGLAAMSHELPNYLTSGFALRDAADEIERTIPAWSTVSTVEAGMPLLYRNRTLRLYPVGIDGAQYALLGATVTNGAPIYSGALSLLGEDESLAINSELVTRMRRDGYDVDHPTLIPRLGLAIVHRVPHGTKPANAGADSSSVSAVAASPAPTPTIPPPLAIAAIGQHLATVAPRGAATLTDLTGTLPKRPANGHIVLAFASTGFGCKVAPGWTLLGSNDGAIAAVAYHIVGAADTSSFVPFTTATANGYALDLIEVDGGPDIVASTQVGGAYALAMQVVNRTSLAVPQKGGVLFAFDAAYTRDARATQDVVALPAGQKQLLIDRIPHVGNAAGLTVQATSTDPFSAKQPFASSSTVTFASKAPPGNIVLSWLVWVGGRR